MPRHSRGNRPAIDARRGAADLRPWEPEDGMANPKGEAFWRAVVVEAEGRSAAQVAARHGVSLSSVHRWQQKLAAKARTAIVPLRVAEAAAVARRVEVRVGEVKVVFEEGTDPAYVAAVARALGA